MSIPVVLVDDHPVVRAGLSAVLEASGQIQIVGEAAGIADAISVVAQAKPRVVLMDLRLGQEDGVEATRRLLELMPALRVLILTTFDTDSDILRAIESGACGYLLKDAPPERLVAAVRDADRGETVLAPVVAGRLAARLRNEVRTLTPRELEVLKLAGEGMGNRKLAAAMFLSEATVKTHLVNAFRKLGVANRTAAVARARELGLL